MRYISFFDKDTLCLLGLTTLWLSNTTLLYFSEYNRYRYYDLYCTNAYSNGHFILETHGFQFFIVSSFMI